MNTHAIFSSNKTNWETPQGLFDTLNEEFSFTLDPCASTENAKCGFYFTESDDGLTIPWEDNIVFMNPPYGRKETYLWMQKAYSENEALVVCLVASRTDNKWWHEFVMTGADEIRFVKGRIVFVGAEHGAPFPSAVVIFKPHGRRVNRSLCLSVSTMER